MTEAELKRPAHLPKFRNPPLDEVVIGVQFRKPESYSQAYITDVWRLFKNKYPNIKEQTALPPVFETFGKRATPQSIRFQTVTDGAHDRFWFISKDEISLVQFQEDRFLGNWRKRETLNNKYPHFEEIFESFLKDFSDLNGYMLKFDSGGLSVNQCELIYINYIKDDNLNLSKNAFSILDLSDVESEDFILRYREKILKDEKAFARMHVLVTSAVGKDGAMGTKIELTVRGAPDSSSIEHLKEFFILAREKIVLTFVKLTSDSFHEIWGIEK